MDASAEAELERMMGEFLPDVVALAKQALAKMTGLLPGALLMVYDNYNGLVIGFTPTERPSDAVFSIVLFPRTVSIAFLQAHRMPQFQLPQPKDSLLQGSGTVARHVRLTAASDIDRPEVKELIDSALACAAKAFDAGRPTRLIIQSISAKRRPRRPRA